MAEKTGSQKATAGFILSLIGGIIILVWNVLLLVAWPPGAILFGSVSVFGILVMIGGVLMFLPGKQLIGGILAIVFSILSLITLGGFGVGFILGLIGGILGLLKK